MTEFSKNETAEAVFGRRGTGMPIDVPSELGYWCPVCELIDDDDSLTWSEYNCMLYCYRCNKDFPSVLCVPLEGEKDAERPWRNVGVDDAMKILFMGIDQALRHASGVEDE